MDHNITRVLDFVRVMQKNGHDMNVRYAVNAHCMGKSHTQQYVRRIRHECVNCKRGFSAYPDASEVRTTPDVWDKCDHKPQLPAWFYEKEDQFVQELENWEQREKNAPNN